MELNFSTNKALERVQEGPSVEKTAADTEVLFDKVSNYWNTLSDIRREEILMVKELKIIESVLQALNDVNFLSRWQGKSSAQETGRRTVLYPRLNKPAMILSITEFNNIVNQDESLNERPYHASVVVLMLLGPENLRQPKNSLPVIEEKELREYIYNIELLEQHKTLLKVKHSKLKGILSVFAGLDSQFCQGSHEVTPEEQHWKLFHSQSQAQFSHRKSLNTQSKVSRYLRSVLKIFENNLIAAYEEHAQCNEDLDDQIDETQQYQQNSEPEQAGFDQQQAYYQQYHRQSSQYYNHYQHDSASNYQYYQGHYSNYMGYMASEQYSQNYYSRNYRGKYKTRLVPVAYGIYFGNLSFTLKDHNTEEQEYGDGDEDLSSRRIKSTSYVYKIKREYTTDYYYKPKRYYQSYNSNSSHYYNDHRNNYPVSNQQEQYSNPLQILLGNSNPLKDSQPQQKPEINATNSIPLLESIIQIPGAKPIQPSTQPQVQVSQILSFEPKRGAAVVDGEDNKSNTSEPPSRGSPKKQPEDDAIKLFEEQLSNARLDELELSTTTSMESTSKNGDKETQGEFYQKARAKPSESSYKKKLKSGTGSKHRGNGRNKEWDRNSNGAKASDTQGKRQTEFSQNFNEYSFDAFPILDQTSNPRAKEK